MFPTKNNITYELTYISNEGDSQMNKFSFTVTKGMYLPQVILKAAYAFIKDAYIHIDETPDTWIINFSLKNDTGDHAAFMGEFENELISQAVRWNVYQQTHTLRELLMARAMTSTMIDDNDPMERITGDQADIDENELNSILTNWFDSYEKKN